MMNSRQVSIELLSKLEPIDDLDDSFANRAFYKGSEGKLISVSWELSFVLVEFMHVGFVPEDEYAYSIPYLVERSKYLVTLIDAGDNNKIVTFQPGLEQTSEIELDEAKEDVVETKTVQLSEKVEIKEEIKKPTLIYYELAKPEPIAEPEPVAVAEEKTEVVPEVSEPTEVKETTIIIYNLVKEEPAVEKVDAPVTVAEEDDEVKEASVIPVVVEEKPVEVEEVETIKPVENQPYFYEDRVASNVAIEDYTLPAEEQMPAVTKDEAKEKGTVAKKNILFYVAVTLLVLLIIAIVTISILGIVHLTTDIKFFKSL